MNGLLFGVGAIAALIGIVLTISETGGRVRASTDFGDFSGAVGPVALLFGLTLMGLSVML